VVGLAIYIRNGNDGIVEVNMDSLDEKILQLMGQDARKCSEALTKNLKISATTVRRRVTRLLKSGVLRIVGVV
jgi:DNA-binding Lrp family transcriptional regulator